MRLDDLLKDACANSAAAKQAAKEAQACQQAVNEHRNQLVFRSLEEADDDRFVRLWIAESLDRIAASLERSEK